MKYLLEFNEYDGDDFLELSEETIEEVKELLFDVLQHDIEDKIPTINTGYFSFDNPAGGLRGTYVEKKAYDDINSVYVYLRGIRDVIDITRINKSLNLIDENLICLFVGNNLVVTNKIIIQRINTFINFSNSLEIFLNDVYGLDDWEKWEDDIGFSDLSFSTQSLYFSIVLNYNYIKVSFYLPEFSINKPLKELEVSFSVEEYLQHKTTNPSPAFSVLDERSVLKEVVERARKSTNGSFSIDSDIYEWLDTHILSHIKTKNSIACERLEQKMIDLSNYSELELEYDKVSITNFEILLRYKGAEKILILSYEVDKDELTISDEFDKELERCNLDSLEESLFLIITENM